MALVLTQYTSLHKKKFKTLIKEWKIIYIFFYKITTFFFFLSQSISLQ